MRIRKKEEKRVQKYAARAPWMAEGARFGP